MEASGFLGALDSTCLSTNLEHCCTLTTVVIEIGTGWLLAVVMTDNIGVGIQDRIECAEGTMVPLLAGMCTYLEGIFL